MIEEDGDISEDFEFKYANGDKAIVGIDLIRVQDQIIVGDKIKEDCLCDSEHMLNIMTKVAVAMREKFHLISKVKKLYLVMDNAGGHGTGNSINQYNHISKEKHIGHFESVNISRNQFD